MDTLLRNARAARHSYALGNSKNECPVQVDLLVGNHHSEETVTLQQQATSAKFSIAKCINRATSYVNTGIRSIPWPEDLTAIRRSKPLLFRTGSMIIPYYEAARFARSLVDPCRHPDNNSQFMVPTCRSTH